MPQHSQYPRDTLELPNPPLFSSCIFTPHFFSVNVWACFGCAPPEEALFRFRFRPILPSFLISTLPMFFCPSSPYPWLSSFAHPSPLDYLSAPFVPTWVSLSYSCAPRLSPGYHFLTNHWAVSSRSRIQPPTVECSRCRRLSASSPSLMSMPSSSSSSLCPKKPTTHMAPLRIFLKL